MVGCGARSTKGKVLSVLQRVDILLSNRVLLVDFVSSSGVATEMFADSLTYTS